MTESHDLDKAIFGEPLTLFDHVIEHHRDLRYGPADVDETEEKKIEKYLTPRRYVVAPVALLDLVHLIHLRVLSCSILSPVPIQNPGLR